MARLLSGMVRNAPFPLLVDETREAARAFFMQSGCWQHRAAVMVVSSTVDLELPPESVLSYVYLVRMDGAVLCPRDDYYVPDDDRSVLALRPGLHGRSVQVEAALCPSYDASGIPVGLEQEHGAAVRYGALARLKVMSGTEWFDPAGAQIYHEKFNREIAVARRRTILGRADGPLMLRRFSLF